MSIQLEDGKKYRNKLGQVLTVKLVAPGTEFPFEGVEDPMRFMENGYYMPERGLAVNDLDLIEQV